MRIETFHQASELMDGVKRLMRIEAERAHLLDGIVSRDPAIRYPALRKFYALADEEISQAGRSDWGIDPYEVNWMIVFTPIECALWHDIRAAGAVFYPQYPVGRYFVDFANPVAKVAVECDGRAYHQDAERDQIRQCAIEAKGWTVYRITGAMCFTDFDEASMQRGGARQLIDEIVGSFGVGRK